jgi:hypothetical protein
MCLAAAVLELRHSMSNLDKALPENIDEIMAEMQAEEAQDAPLDSKLFERLKEIDSCSMPPSRDRTRLY